MGLRLSYPLRLLLAVATTCVCWRVTHIWCYTTGMNESQTWSQYRCRAVGIRIHAHTFDVKQVVLFWPAPKLLVALHLIKDGSAGWFRITNWHQLMSVTTKPRFVLLWWDGLLRYGSTRSYTTSWISKTQHKPLGKPVISTAKQLMACQHPQHGSFWPAIDWNLLQASHSWWMSHKQIQKHQGNKRKSSNVQ